MPLKIDKDGNRKWYNSKGQLHREDGPAIEWSNGIKEWWIDGKRHREDGPAIECSNGYKEWYINDKKLTEEEYNANLTGKQNLEKEVTNG